MTEEPSPRSSEDKRDGFERSAGAWNGKLDFDAYLTDLRESRKGPSRDVSL